MELRQIDPGDAAAVASYVDVTNEVRDVDSPWEHRMTQAEGAGLLRFGWDLEPAVGFLAVVDGEVVGLAEYSTSTWDNHHLAWLWVSVRPSARRRGHGSALVELMADRAGAEKRTTIGIGGWDNEAARAFAKRHGFELKSQEVCRRQYLADLDRAALAARQQEALPHAAAYELVRRLGRTPDDELAALAAVTAAINDAPLDDLDVEDEVFSAERVRNYETAQLGQGQRLHRVVARHRETGELAGHTVVAVSGERPENAEQHDTAVVQAHRGHRLGLLLKADMLDWLAETQPQVTSIETWNAESNDQMIGVNEVLGYRVMGRALQFQRSLRGATYAGAMSDQPAAEHRRPEGVDDATVEAVGRLTEALETVERARGHLYSFHQLTGEADFKIGDAVDQLRDAGHPELADRLQREIVGRNVLEGRWTFQIMEEYDDTYWSVLRDAERGVREQLTGGRRHLAEAELKEQRRTPGHPDHTASPG